MSTRLPSAGRHTTACGAGPRNGRIGSPSPACRKDRTTAWIPNRQLHEYFVPTFRAAIDAGLRTVMVNSGDINGVPVHASHEILTDLLRRDLGFTGVAVSDWEDVNRLFTVHRVARDAKDAVRMAVMAGIDMSMVPYNLSFYHHLLALVKEGTVPVSRITRTSSFRPTTKSTSAMPSSASRWISSSA